MESYRQSYSFRHAIEPAALREPGFHADPALLERLLDEQLRLVAGEFHTLSPVRLFDLNSAMHESLVECSGNSFFIDSLRRVNRLRRLIEYDLPLDREKARLRCEEHVEILELVQNGHNEMAAIAMEMHLEKLGPIKARR